MWVPNIVILSRGIKMIQNIGTLTISLFINASRTCGLFTVFLNIIGIEKKLPLSWSFFAWNSLNSFSIDLNFFCMRQYRKYWGLFCPKC